MATVTQTQQEIRRRAIGLEEVVEQPTRQPAPVRNLYVAAMAYDGFTLTDGALRIVVLLHADRLGFNAIQIAIMFSLYEVSLFAATGNSRSSRV